MGGQIDTADEVIVRIASSQHGVVTRVQLLAAGVSARAIDATLVAAVLACGNGSVLSGPAAGHLLEILRGRLPAPDVTTRSARRPEGVIAHRTRALDPRDITTWKAIPVTTPARTLVDLAAVVSAEQLARAMHEASIRHGTTPDDVEAVLARRPNSPGAAQLRAVLRGDTKVTLSRLEQAFLRLLAENRLPLPTTNRRVGGRLVDCREATSSAATPGAT
jgi:hypothetical protein